MKTFATLATLALTSATLYTEDAGTDMSLNKNDHAKAFCAEGYKLVPSDTGTFHNSSSFDTGNGTANDGLTGANATTFETCEKCPGTETSAGGTSRSCHAVSNTWATCSHMGCQLEEVATKACAKHGSSNPSTDLAAGTPIVEMECQDWTSTQVQRIKVFHHGHEQAGTSHTCKLSGSRADTNRACECQCKTATVSEQEGRDGPVSGTNAPTNKAPSESTMAELVDSGASWVQTGANIDGEAAGDASCIVSSACVYTVAASLSADGQTLAVSAYTNEDNSIKDVGHVRIYTRGAAGWVQRGADIYTRSASLRGSDLTGYSVSLSADGQTVAIGAHEKDQAGTSTKGTAAGPNYVRIYTWGASSWVQRGADIEGEAVGDDSGTVSLSADGQTVAIGAPCALGPGGSWWGSDVGHVRIYTWGAASSWVQRGADIDGEARGDQSGYSVSLSADGQTVAIGSYINGQTKRLAGHVRIYTWVASSWVQRGADIDGEAAYDVSGATVSLSADGQTVAISCMGYDGAFQEAGRVRIYTWGTSSWVQRGADIDGEARDDSSGIAISLSADGQTVAIASRINGKKKVQGAGYVRIYTWGASSWVQAGADIDGEASPIEPNGSRSVSLSADGQAVAVVGDWYTTGFVRAYSLTTPITV